MNNPPRGATFEVEVIRDIEFGQAPVGYGTAQARLRPLLLDAYLPSGDGATAGNAITRGDAAIAGSTLGSAAWGPRPTLILSHGGAYHRGAKDVEHFEQDGHVNTAMSEYCRRFAARGYACFSVGYRLTQERTAPQPMPIRRNRGQVPRGRIDYVRELLGLPPASDEELLNGVEAAIADVAMAARFVIANASRWSVDTARIALGGFSAGAFASVYSAYALGVPAAAIVSLSGGMDPEDASWYLHGTRGQPPVLMFSSEFDLPGIPERTRTLADAGAQAGLGLRRYFVPGKPHFYTAETEVELQQSTLSGGAERATVESAIDDFLSTTLASPTMDETRLQAFADAWCRHDLDALMSFMTDDCVFHSGAGPDASGTRYVGRDAVRAGFAKAWADIPDAQWTRPRHFVSGNRGVSEWTFTGTRTSDGVRVEVDGCDIFTFSGNLIRVKDSWRKQRT